MRILLDTHALLWWAIDDPRLSRGARRAIADDDAIVFVSAASAWEIATKFRLGKLPNADGIAAELPRYAEQQGFEELTIGIGHAARAGMLPGPHRDPFGRVLTAQAQIEDLAIVSIDPIFERYGVRRVW